ncbi:MAG: hypothetical protein M1480_13650 [Bacteroidetes bacterium]|nr:hypothetical protein [Bacteroidota bacterium]
MRIFEVAVIVFLFNVPFGYWRANVKKFSLQWVLAIHIPVPVVVALRFLSGIGFAFITYPILVGSFFLGQFAGAKIHNWWLRNLNSSASSCLPCDIIKAFGFDFKKNILK